MLHLPALPRASRRRVAVISTAIAAIVATGVAGSSLAFASTKTPEAPETRSVAATPATLPIQEISESARTTVDEAQTALTVATMLNSTVAASGLPVPGATVVDTAALRENIDLLDNFTITPVLLLPPVAGETATETAQVLAEVADLQTRVDDTKAQILAAAAAEQARIEEEARAAEAARVAAIQAAANTPDNAKAIARQMAAANYGWGDGEFSCLESLWTKESGWNYQAANPSGAFGIPQSLPGSKMASVAPDWQTNAATQIAWGLGYIDGRYGSPCSAWGHSQSVNWY